MSRPVVPVRAPDVATGPAADAGLDGFDEMVTGQGRLRPGWGGVIEALHAMPPGQFDQRAARAQRQFAETGIAYADSAGPTLDALPMLLPGAEWQHLARGLDQRARLLGRIAADLYGDCSLLAEGLVPPALLYANPRFLRPCVGLRPAGGTHLHAYAADLVRTPDGIWHVAADRLQAPGGIGGALHNRAVLARTLPELFRTASVGRLEPFFEMWAQRLVSLAPDGLDGRAPRVALLTPGHFNAHFLEHVLLAQQLGAALVQGDDLTMRDNRLHLKTLASLQPVDVLLRFMDDDFTDPLELRSDSVIGVPGLLQAVRAGRLSLLNSPGASVVETPALRRFLPRLCERLLGEALLLPSLPARWPADSLGVDSLGDPADALRPAFGAGSARGVAAGGRPELFVAEPPRPRSVAPVWGEGRMLPAAVELRMFLVHDGAGYVALPGGLTRATDEAGRRLVKDTWVSSGGTGRSGAAPSAAAPHRLPITPVPDDLRSRTADDLFWLGRYTERLDNAARLVRAVALRLAAESLGPGEASELRHILRLLEQGHGAEASLAEALPDGRGLLGQLAQLWGRDRPLGDMFDAVGRIAQSLRDRLSRDMEQVVLVPLHHARETLSRPQGADDMIAGLEGLVGLIAAFGGMASENMTQGSGWHFLDIGRRLERALFGAAALSELLDGTEREGDAPLALALELSDSAITYHSRYLGALGAGPVADLLLADAHNPRSVGFQLERIVAHLGRLRDTFAEASAGGPGLALPHAPGRDAADELLRQVRASALDRLDDPAARARLLHALAGIRQQLLALSDRLTRAYFAHTRMPQAIGFGPVAGR